MIISFRTDRPKANSVNQNEADSRKEVNVFLEQPDEALHYL